MILLTKVWGFFSFSSIELVSIPNENIFKRERVNFCLRQALELYGISAFFGRIFFAAAVGLMLFPIRNAPRMHTLSF